MSMALDDPPLGFWAELRLIATRAMQVWWLVPRRYKCALLGSALLIVITSLCCTLIPLQLGRLVDQIKAGTESGLDTATLSGIAGFSLFLLGVTYLVRESLHILRRYLAENACTRVEKELTTRLIDHLIRVDLGALNQQKIGALHGRIQRCVIGCVKFLGLSVLDFSPALMTGAFALVATVSKQPILGIVMLGVGPISVYLTVRQLLTQKGVRLSLNSSREHMDGTVVELLHGLDYVRAANTAGLETGRVAAAAEGRRVKEIRHHFEMSLYGCAKALNEAFFHILVLSFSVYFAIQGSISFGDILIFSMLFLNVMTPLAEVHRVLDDGHECSLQVGILVDLLDQPTDCSFAPAKVFEPHIGDDEPALVVENLRMAYRNEEGKPTLALNGVSLEVRHGETIGVAGRSGGGKSSWLRVLLRLAHPENGRVRIGGVPIDNVSREAIGRLIGYVGQSPFVIAGTIAENIAYGCTGVSEADIIRAAQLACIHDEIEAMPRGYHSRVTERGTNLSGGQRQRIALARVFLKNPPILILDEGTSALDNISERAVQRAIEAARADRTVILVAHRLSTLRDADRIVVFDEGRIVESGTYGELLRADGVFAELARNAEDIVEVPVPVLAEPKEPRERKRMLEAVGA
jgi:ATP-binding cassette subfamily B protein